MRLRSFLMSFVVLAFVSLVGAPFASGDGLEVNLSNIVFTGGDLCGPSGTSSCTVTINGSYDQISTSDVGSASVSIKATGAFSDTYLLQFVGEGAVQFFGTSIFNDYLATGIFSAPGTFDTAGDTSLISLACSVDGFYGMGRPLASTSGSIIVSPFISPEPSSLLLLATGLLGLGAAVRRFAQS